MMRFLLIRVACVLLAVGSARADKWVTQPVDQDKLRGRELIQFTEAVIPLTIYGGEFQKPLDLSMLVRLYAHYVANARFLSKEDEQMRARSTQCELEAVMRNSLSKTDLPTLRRITLGDDKNNYGNDFLFDTLCHRWIEQEIAKIMSEPKRKLAFPEEPPPLPDILKSFVPAGSDLTEYHRAVGPFAKLLADLSRQKPRGIYAEGTRFEELKRAFLLGREKTVAAELLRFTWDSWCGTGEQEFEDIKMMLVFMGLLRERRIGEAVGVSFFVPHSPEWMHEPGRPFDQWRIDLLKYCGFDWEAAMLGAGARQLAFLAAAGSEKAARQGVATMKAPGKPSEKFPWSMETLIDFLIPGEPGPWNDADPRRAISAETQAEMLALLDSALRDDLPFYELDKTLELFEELRRPETKGTLRRLLKHPSTTYAERAAAVLRSLHEEIEPIAPAPPVRFRIFLNEQPWRSAELSYTMQDSSGSSPGSGSLKTDAEGFTVIPRDEFLDPAKRGTRLRFYQMPQSGNVWSERVYDQAWIETEVAIPKAYDEVTAVHITAARVPIEISYASPPPASSVTATDIRLMKAGQPNGTGWFLHFADDRVQVPSRFAFGAIAPGMYQLVILAPGSASHTTEPFEVKPGMSPIQVKLEKGSEVYAAIYLPGNARGAREIRLFRGNEDVTEVYPPPYWGETTKPLFSGVPKGSYQLRILSTEEFMRLHKITEWESPSSPRQPDPRQGVDCEGLTVAFTIDDTTPPRLDLGRLENKAVDAMRDKAESARLLIGGALVR